MDPYQSQHLRRLQHATDDEYGIVVAAVYPEDRAQWKDNYSLLRDYESNRYRATPASTLCYASHPLIIMSNTLNHHAGPHVVPAWEIKLLLASWLPLGC